MPGMSARGASSFFRRSASKGGIGVVGFAALVFLVALVLVLVLSMVVVVVLEIADGAM